MNPQQFRSQVLFCFGVALQLANVNCKQTEHQDKINNSTYHNRSKAIANDSSLSDGAAILIGCVVTLYDLAFCIIVLYSIYYYFNCRNNFGGNRTMERYDTKYAAEFGTRMEFYL